MYKFASDRNKIVDTVASECAIGFSVMYLTSCSFVVRLLIVVIGLICIILVAIGYEHDAASNSPSKNSFQNQTEVEVFYSGYGTGYKAELLTRIFLAVVVICSFFSLFYLLLLVCIRKASTDWRRLNRCSYFAFGLVLVAGTICGGFGLEYFQEKCCHIDSHAVNITSFNYRYHQTEAEGYSNLCLCTLKTNLSFTIDSYYWNANYSNYAIKSAYPHHQSIHACSLLMSFINCILFLVASIVP